MKKFIAGCVIVALILLALKIVQVKLGGGLDWSSLWSTLIDKNALLSEEVHYDIEENMIFDNEYDVLTGNIEKYELGSNIKKLDIEAGGCAFSFEASDDEHFYVEATNAGKLQCYVKNATLYIKTTRTVVNLGDSYDCEIILYIPENYHFEDVDVELGAGLLEIGAVASDEIDMEVGAGQINVADLKAEQFDAEVGMGEMIVENMQATTVNASVGMGHLLLEGEILGNADVECSMGSAELHLDGKEKDFNYKLESAMGNVSVGNEDYSGMTHEKTINNSADKNINIECAVGSLEINFEN